MEPLNLFTKREILSVSELVSQLKRTVEDRFDFIWVQGEISGLRRPGSGHYYFALKDDKASLRAVLFRQQASALRFALEDGQSVLCQGRLGVYQPRGEVQLIVESVEPRGAGALALAFEQLKRKLMAEGLFEPERKQALPEMPRKVAVVTSPSGAAIHDFLKVLRGRFASVQVAVYPVAVQGEQAAPQAVQALQDLAQWGWPEVIVITRGGGSPEDLASFNDEALARAVAVCPIPVVSAVGHEVDVSICDLVADLRAPTPSAAAEMLIKPRADLAARLQALWRGLLGAGERISRVRRHDLHALVRYMPDPGRALANQRLRIDDMLARAEKGLTTDLHLQRRKVETLARRLAAARPERRLATTSARFGELERTMFSVQVRGLEKRRSRLTALEAKLRALSPLAVLGRGYALITDQAGTVLRRADQAEVGMRVRARLGQGQLLARVEKVEK